MGVVGRAGALCRRHDDGIGVVRGHGDAPDVPPVEPGLRVGPRLAPVGRLRVAVAGGRVEAARCVRMRRDGVGVQPRAVGVIHPRLAAVDRPDERAGLDGDSEASRIGRIHRDPADVVGVGARGERPAVGRWEVRHSRAVGPGVASVGGVEHPARLGPGPDDLGVVGTDRDGGHALAERGGGLPGLAAVGAPEQAGVDGADEEPLWSGGAGGQTLDVARGVAPVGSPGLVVVPRDEDGVVGGAVDCGHYFDLGLTIYDSCNGDTIEQRD